MAHTYPLVKEKYARKSLTFEEFTSVHVYLFIVIYFSNNGISNERAADLLTWVLFKTNLNS